MVRFFASELIITAPRPSASSNGNKSTDVQINGLPVIVGANAYIKPEH